MCPEHLNEMSEENVDEEIKVAVDEKRKAQERNYLETLISLLEESQCDSNDFVNTLKKRKLDIIKQIVNSTSSNDQKINHLLGIY